jgi:hypothetical protein
MTLDTALLIVIVLCELVSLGESWTASLRRRQLEQEAK